MTSELVSVAVAAPSAAYGARMPRATRFVADAAEHMRLVAHAVGARLTELHDADASRAAVTAAIRAAAERLRGTRAGLFVLSFAGHGGRVTDVSADEPDHFDEAWALDDGLLVDDQLTELLGELHRDVHVVVISNCCFGGGMVDEERPGVDGPPRAATSADAIRAPADARIGRWALGSSDGLTVPQPGEPPPRPAPAATNRIVIASCRDNQMMVLPDSSRLTLRVLDAVFPVEGETRRRQATDYAALEVQVTRMASVSQTPVVLASDHDKLRPAFVPQPLVRS